MDAWILSDCLLREYEPQVWRLVRATGHLALNLRQEREIIGRQFAPTQQQLKPCAISQQISNRLLPAWAESN